MKSDSDNDHRLNGSSTRLRGTAARKPPVVVGMRRRWCTWPGCVLVCLLAAACIGQETESYPIPPEAERQDGVPAGRIEGPFPLTSKVYPGTQREYWLYIPAQYKAEQPACVLVVQDGLRRAEGWRLPTVCDNLIHSQQMPVTVGIFVTPGVVPALRDDAQPRFNRSFEYDSLGDRYARFLLEELLPAAGKKVNLSHDPNDRALAGASSGGICAFNVAWERPDAFRRVLSTIGTFVGLRGGNELAVLVRKTEPKPLRVFLQDGSRDLNIYAGDWWVANQDMLSALTWAGYDVHHVWGEGGHNGQHAAAILPDALRWLWRDYPEPIVPPAASDSQRRIDILIDGANWEQVSSGHESAEAPACNADGELFFADPRAGRIYRIGDDGKTRIFADQIGRVSSMSFGPQGNLFVCRDGQQICRIGPDGAVQTLIQETLCRQIVTLPDGFYYTDPSGPAVWWSNYEGQSQRVVELIEPASGLIPTSDHAFMHLISGRRQFTLHARIAEDRSLEFLQPYGFLHLPYLRATSGAACIAIDVQSRTYVGTPIGIQVLDQLGRVNFIIRNPSADPPGGLAFGGLRRDVLFVTSGENVYRRKLKTQAARPAAEPLTPPKPRL